MKNLKIILGIVIFLSLNSIYSCEKTELIDQKDTQEITCGESEENAQVKVEYYLNDNEISKNPFELKENKSADIKHIIVVFEKIEKSTEKTITINSFSNDKEYISWGEKRNIPVSDMLSKENTLHEFIEKNNVIEINEKTGKIPEIYTTFEQELLNSNNKIAFPITIHTDCAGGSAWIVANTLPTLVNTKWDNAISKYMDHAAYGGVSWYDKKWYRDKLATSWNYGWKFICFKDYPDLEYVDNKTTSLINW